MMGKYAEYQGKTYPVVIRNGKYRLRSRVQDMGFEELIDLGGNKHKDIFVKEVKIEDIDVIYELQYKIIYQGKEYSPFVIGELAIENDKITLFSKDYEDYEKNGFQKKEQFVFVKEVGIDNIEGIIEIKKPILDFKGLPEEKKYLSKNSISHYINNFE